jgi:hypothetical protein
MYEGQTWKVETADRIDYCWNWRRRIHRGITSTTTMTTTRWWWYGAGRGGGEGENEGEEEDSSVFPELNFEIVCSIPDYTLYNSYYYFQIGIRFCKVWTEELPKADSRPVSGRYSVRILIGTLTILINVLSPYRQTSRHYFDQANMASFQILSNSLFTSHPTIPRYINWQHRK